MPKRNQYHSFSLWPDASQIVTDVQSGRKSRYVSKAIIWFSKPREVNTAYGMRVVNMSEQIMAHEELIKRYTKVCKENVKLREELQKNESFISRMLKVFGK